MAKNVNNGQFNENLYNMMEKGNVIQPDTGNTSVQQFEQITAKE